MGFTSDACWFLLIKSLLIANNKKREAALKNEAGGDEKHVFFLLGLICMEATKRKRKAPFRKLPFCKVDKALLRFVSLFFPANFSAP